MTKKIQILKKIKYKGIPIYIRRLDTRFEFLLTYNNEIYFHYIDIKPEWHRRFRKELYTKKQIHNIIQILYKIAETTIKKLNVKK